MRSLCIIFLLLLPWFCSAKCAPTAAIKIKVEASDSDKQKLVTQLEQHGRNYCLGIEPTDAGFDYRIALADILKQRMTLTQAGIGSAEDAILLTTVFDDKGTVLFQFGRGNRLTRRGVLNASAKEIIKRLIRLHSNPKIETPRGGVPNADSAHGLISIAGTQAARFRANMRAEKALVRVNHSSANCDTIQTHEHGCDSRSQSGAESPPTPSTPGNREESELHTRFGGIAGRNRRCRCRGLRV